MEESGREAKIAVEDEVAPRMPAMSEASVNSERLWYAALGSTFPTTQSVAARDWSVNADKMIAFCSPLSSPSISSPKIK